MTHRIPTVSNSTLHEHIEEVSSTDTIVVGSSDWFTWLEHHYSFRFDHPLWPLRPADGIYNAK